MFLKELFLYLFLYFCYHVFVKNCEDERVATGAVTKCTIDAMDALNLRALANELRQLDRKFPDRVPTLCVPTCVTCASKARKIHQNTAATNYVSIPPLPPPPPPPPPPPSRTIEIQSGV
jgi:hypothetical protein